MKTQFIEAIGRVAGMVLEWKEDGVCECPSNAGVHKGVVEVPCLEHQHIDYNTDERRPVQCDACQRLPPSEDKVDRWLYQDITYNTPTGRPTPGDMYWTTHPVGRCYYHWTNCDGKHLNVICPNGMLWDLMSRCSNCGSPQDTEHRCWVAHISPEGIVHVDKNGHTCSAGGGSIDFGPTYHGFMHNGEFNP
jgi:hypothetical protein